MNSTDEDKENIRKLRVKLRSENKTYYIVIKNRKNCILKTILLKKRYERILKIWYEEIYELK